MNGLGWQGGFDNSLTATRINAPFPLPASIPCYAYPLCSPHLLLDVVVGESPSILELLSGKDETLLVRGNTLLVLDLLLDVVDRVRRLDIKGDGFAGESFDEDLGEVGRVWEVKEGLDKG